jgi:hypothetical protein
MQAPFLKIKGLHLIGSEINIKGTVPTSQDSVKLSTVKVELPVESACLQLLKSNPTGENMVFTLNKNNGTTKVKIIMPMSIRLLTIIGANPFSSSYFTSSPFFPRNFSTCTPNCSK